MPCSWQGASIRLTATGNLLQETPLKGHCAVVTSYEPKEVDIQHGHSEESRNEAEFVYETSKEMMGDMSQEKFEDAMKKKFIDEIRRHETAHCRRQAPHGLRRASATYMYIDKEMRDHNLFQAICRVNRVNGAKKEYGYIIDYKDLFNEIESSIEDYTNGAFSGYDKEDVGGLLNGLYGECPQGPQRGARQPRPHHRACRPTQGHGRILRLFRH